MRRGSILLTAMIACCACGPSEPVPASADSARGPATAVVPPAAPTATASAESPGPPPTPQAAEAQETLDARFVPVIAAAFKEYKPWGRWDDEMRWAPWLCRMPRPGLARMSAADDGGHARKLYSIFAKHRGMYGYAEAIASHKQAVGQVVVKEAYFPEIVEKEEREPPQDVTLSGEGDHFHRYARDEHHLYRASELAGVYVMAKLAAGTDGTDAGWIYGTVTPGGEVTSAGRVASCMGCHVDAGPDRLFGAKSNTESIRIH